MKQVIITATILTLVACKSNKEITTQTSEQKPTVERNLFYSANNEEQWSLNYYDDKTATFVRYGDTIVKNEIMSIRDQQDGYPTVYYQLSDQDGFYFEIENSRCYKENIELNKSITIFQGGESFQGCVEGFDNKTDYHDKWNLVNIPSLDKKRIYDMPVRPYLIINQEENLINGSTGCNILNGTFIMKGQKAGFGRLIMTKRGCNDMELESEIIKRIESSNRMEIKDVNLTLYIGDDAILEYRLAE
mgnify:CR=1 FL=1